MVCSYHILHVYSQLSNGVNYGYSAVVGLAFKEDSAG